MVISGYGFLVIMRYLSRKFVSDRTQIWPYRGCKPGSILTHRHLPSSMLTHHSASVCREFSTAPIGDHNVAVSHALSPR